MTALRLQLVLQVKLFVDLMEVVKQIERSVPLNTCATRQKGQDIVVLMVCVSIRVWSVLKELLVKQDL